LPFACRPIGSCLGPPRMKSLEVRAYDLVPSQKGCSDHSERGAGGRVDRPFSMSGGPFGERLVRHGLGPQDGDQTSCGNH
jgi:hypothetical protein